MIILYAIFDTEVMGMVGNISRTNKLSVNINLQCLLGVSVERHVNVW